MVQWLILFVIVLLVALWLWWYRMKATKRRDTGKLWSFRKYQAVAIRRGSAACKAVTMLEGKRFLSMDAPPLPLPDCDAKNCRCRYIYFDDRRQDDRRDSDGGPLGGVAQPDPPRRRLGTDRRQST